MTIRILQGDCRQTLTTLADQSVNCCVTSPPYWGLRDYGTEPLEWPAIAYAPMPCLPPIVEVPAMRASLGLEPDINAFIGHMVLIFREVRRVLRDDGVLFMNMGDGYAGSWGAQGRDGGDVGRKGSPISQAQIEAAPKGRRTGSLDRVPGLKPKDLIGQPWRLALALQADGWWLRQDIIWDKPNPMPESAQDRCTKAHEYIFLLAKSQRYHWDSKAMQEPVSGGANPRRASNGVGFGHGYDGQQRQRGRQTWKTPDEGDTSAGEGQHGTIHKEGREKGRKPAAANSGTKNNTSMDAALAVMPTTRNRRSVWRIATEACKQAHFATFPTALVEPCIKAACPPGGTVLDIFGGAGTTGLVADRLQRHAILCELNPAYIEIARQRLAAEAPLLTEIAT